MNRRNGVFSFIPEAVRRGLLEPNQANPEEQIVTGLSEAILYRCQMPAGYACLRRWPAGHIVESKLQLIRHAIQSVQARNHSFLPRVFPTRTGQTYLSVNSHFWDLTEWLPGQADYIEQPSEKKLVSAVDTLASMHEIWAEEAVCGPSPAMHDRLRFLSEAMNLGERIATSGTSLVESQCCRDTAEQLRLRGADLLQRLQHYASKDTDIHIAVRDIWSDHVLFAGEAVSGIVDFGAMRIDEPATDVARLLGSLEPLDIERWQLGFNTYSERIPQIDKARVRLLDEVSCLLSAVQWCKWLVLERKQFRAPVENLFARWQGFLTRLACDPWKKL